MVTIYRCRLLTQCTQSCRTCTQLLSCGKDGFDVLNFLEHGSFVYICISCFWPGLSVFGRSEKVVLGGGALLERTGHILQLTSGFPFLCLLFASVEPSSQARLLLNLGAHTGLTCVSSCGRKSKCWKGFKKTSLLSAWKDCYRLLDHVRTLGIAGCSVTWP